VDAAEAGVGTSLFVTVLGAEGEGECVGVMVSDLIGVAGGVEMSAGPL